MKFNDIISPNVQILGLEKSIYTNTVIQSLIIEGQEGTGKTTLADIYANALVCRSGEDKPCGRCKGCVLFSSKNHPDIIEVKREKKKSIGVEEIKTLVKQAVIKPNESTKKVFIIKDAHTMTAQAQNALLKLIEEPPSYLSIILLCENTMTLLETIISRCSVIPMPYLSFENIVDGLKTKGIESNAAKIAAQGANGSMGRALNRCENPEYQEIREEMLEILFLTDKSKTKAYEAAVRQRGKTRDMIGLWQSVLRDALMYKSQEIDNIENIDKMNRIDAYAKAHSTDELIEKLEALCDAETRLYYNAQYKLVLDNLMIKI